MKDKCSSILSAIGRAGKEAAHDGKAQGALQVRGPHVIQKYYKARPTQTLHLNHIPVSQPEGSHLHLAMITVTPAPSSGGKLSMQQGFARHGETFRSACACQAVRNFSSTLHEC